MKDFMARYIVLALIAFMVVALIKGTFAAEVPCSKHPIYCQIKKNKPSINSTEAMNLSNIIYKVTKKWKVPARIYTAILMQESGYRLKVNGCRKGLIPDESVDQQIQECLNPVGPYGGPGCLANINYYKEVKVCSDFGMSQIYYKTARAYNLEIRRLTFDLEYSVNAGAMVLAGFMKRYSELEEFWWTRYNARSTDKRRIYRKLVERYL